MPDRSGFVSSQHEQLYSISRREKAYPLDLSLTLSINWTTDPIDS